MFISPLRRVLAALLLPLCALSYEWVARYDGASDDDSAAAIALSPLGAPCVTGCITESDGSRNLVAIKLDPVTHESTVTDYDYVNRDDTDNGGTDIAVGPTGNIYVTGYSTDRYAPPGDENGGRGRLMKLR